MVVGLISDVHANVIALEAALDALEAKGADTIYCLGDLVGYGSAPNEAIELLREREVLCTLGAADERVAFSFARPAARREGVADEILEWTKGVLSKENLDYLRTLPLQHRSMTEQGWLRFFHGSAGGNNVRLNLSQDPVSLARLLERHRCSILVAGSTHVPFFRRVGAGLVVNPGSVGLSLNGEPGADYALLRVTPGGIDLEMDKVEYDFAAAAFEIHAWGLPPEVADAIMQGRMPDSLSVDPELEP